MTKDILLAAIIGAQGLKGEVKAKIFTDAPEALPRYKRLHAQDGRVFTITAFRSSRPSQEGRPGEAVIAFEEVRDRNAAEALKGTELFVTRAALPQAGEDEFYHADLVGLEAQDSDGRVLGKVIAIHNYGAGDVIEIARLSVDGSPDGDNMLLAFTKETVPTIDIAQGFVIVAVPEDDEDTDHVE